MEALAYPPPTLTPSIDDDEGSQLGCPHPHGIGPRNQGALGTGRIREISGAEREMHNGS